jgi:phosphohistidine phosphatase
MKRASAPAPETSRLLLLIRHGKAAPKDTGLSDFERVLTKEGAEDCALVGTELSGKNLSVDLMLSSPADRALETAHLFASSLNYPAHNIRITDALYSSDSIVPMLAELKHLPVDARTVALFGHNPSFDELAAHFIPGFSQSIPKGAAVAISLDAGLWSNLKKGIGRLQFMVSPMDIREKPPMLQNRARRSQPRGRSRKSGVTL